MILLLCGLLEAFAAERRFVPAVGARAPDAAAADLAATVADGRYDARVYEGSRQLGLSLEFVHFCRMGLEQIFQRRYGDAKTLFAELAVEYPGTAVQPIAELITWQAKMLESWDLRYDREYRAASGRARAELEASAQRPGAESWEQLMLTGVLGIEAMHAARQGKYLGALTMAVSAMEHAEATRAVAPEFVDLALADGLYHYWRAALARTTDLIPDGEDTRAQGIEEIRRVEDHGVFLSAPATLAMVYTWMEEKRLDDALAAAERNRKRYPNNIINEMLLGVVQLMRKDFAPALAAFEHIRKVDPNNQRAVYLRGVALFRLGRLDEARGDLESYLATDIPDTEKRAMGHLRLGQVYEGLGRLEDASLQYRAAVKLGAPNEAKVALAALESRLGTGG
jgi:tetratricopeptide (TPR) repeat protein